MYFAKKASPTVNDILGAPKLNYAHFFTDSTPGVTFLKAPSSVSIIVWRCCWKRVQCWEVERHTCYAYPNILCVRKSLDGKALMRTIVLPSNLTLKKERDKNGHAFVELFLTNTHIELINHLIWHVAWV